MSVRQVAFLIVPAAIAGLCAAAPGPTLANPQHAPRERIAFSATAPRRDRHAREMDTNDLAGHGAWLGCAARHASAGGKEFSTLTAIYCGRAPVFLASAEGAPANLGRAA